MVVAPDSVLLREGHGPLFHIPHLTNVYAYLSSTIEIYLSRRMTWQENLRVTSDSSLLCLPTVTFSMIKGNTNGCRVNDSGLQSLSGILYLDPTITAMERSLILLTHPTLILFFSHEVSLIIKPITYGIKL